MTTGRNVRASRLYSDRPFSRADPAEEHEVGPMGTAGQGLGLCQWQQGPQLHNAASMAMAGKQHSITYDMTVQRSTVYLYVSAGVYIRDRNI